jgi:short/branched chain acyl-CoA dehydrogenase
MSIAAPPRTIDTIVPWATTAEHGAWRETVRAFAEREVAPIAAASSAERRFPAELVPKLGRLGCFGLLVPQAEGGSGADMTSHCIAIEELARVDSSAAITVHVQAAASALLAFLSDGRHPEIVREAAAGETFISFGLTEPGSGSDAGNPATRAVREATGWVLSGAKQFITNAGTEFSKYVVVFARTAEGREPGRPAVSAFLVPLDAPGVTVGAGYDKLGWHASDTHPLFFEDVRLPAQALLGTEGKATREALSFLVWARLPLTAMALGLSQACLEDSVAFVKEREAFGQKLGGFQAMAFKCADIAAMTASVRALLYDACWKRDHGMAFAQEAAICKYVGGELANKASYIATQIHGGYGFVNETAVTRHYADARVLTIGEGTSEIQQLLIARSLGLPV